MTNQVNPTDDFIATVTMTAKLPDGIMFGRVEGSGASCIFPSNLARAAGLDIHDRVQASVRLNPREDLRARTPYMANHIVPNPGAGVVETSLTLQTALGEALRSALETVPEPEQEPEQLHFPNMEPPSAPAIADKRVKRAYRSQPVSPPAVPDADATSVDDVDSRAAYFLKGNYAYTADELACAVWDVPTTEHLCKPQVAAVGNWLRRELRNQRMYRVGKFKGMNTNSSNYVYTRYTAAVEFVYNKKA